MRNRIAAVVIGLAVLCAPGAAIGQTTEGPERELWAVIDRQPYEERYLDIRERFVERVGLREAGRDLVRTGYRRPNGDVRPASREEVVKSTERMLAALRAPAVAPTETAAAETAAAEPTAAAPSNGLAGVVQCESGGDYSAVNPAGYYGAYQFDMQTWQSVGGSGNPAAASPEEQDQRAAMLYAQRGGSPWPNCGP